MAAAGVQAGRLIAIQTVGRASLSLAAMVAGVAKSARYQAAARHPI